VWTWTFALFVLSRWEGGFARCEIESRRPALALATFCAATITLAMPASADVAIKTLGLRVPLHCLDPLFHWLQSGGKHGSGQLGYVAAITDTGLNPLLDQPLLQFHEF
jgi:hypothetical protein